MCNIRVCKKAEEMVSSVENPAYQVAAFQVALDRLLSVPEQVADGRTRAQKPIRQHTNGNGLKSVTQRRILELRDAGFFQEPRFPTEVRTELRTQGFHHNADDVRMALLRLARKKVLRRLNEGDNQYRYGLP